MDPCKIDNQTTTNYTVFMPQQPCFPQPCMPPTAQPHVVIQERIKYVEVEVPVIQEIIVERPVIQTVVEKEIQYVKVPHHRTHEKELIKHIEIPHHQNVIKPCNDCIKRIAHERMPSACDGVLAQVRKLQTLLKNMKNEHNTKLTDVAELRFEILDKKAEKKNFIEGKLKDMQCISGYNKQKIAENEKTIIYFNQQIADKQNEIQKFDETMSSLKTRENSANVKISEMQKNIDINQNAVEIQRKQSQEADVANVYKTNELARGIEKSRVELCETQNARDCRVATLREKANKISVENQGIVAKLNEAKARGEKTKNCISCLKGAEMFTSLPSKLEAIRQIENISSQWKEIYAVSSKLSTMDSTLNEQTSKLLGLLQTTEQTVMSHHTNANQLKNRELDLARRMDRNLERAKNLEDRSAALHKEVVIEQFTEEYNVKCETARPVPVKSTS